VAAANVLSTLPGPAQQILTSREFFPQLISAPFHHGLTIVFAVAAGLAVLAGAASRCAAAATSPRQALVTRLVPVGWQTEHRRQVHPARVGDPHHRAALGAGHPGWRY
jgi:uncharacterized membrane protein YphA (DoxX/SURF4 family)